MASRLGIERLDGMNPIASFMVAEQTASAPFCLGRKGQVILPFEDDASRAVKVPCAMLPLAALLFACAR